MYSMNILIVDDSVNIRNNLKKFFSEITGIIISGEAENAQSAIELFNSSKPDIIILDVELKESSGFDVLEYVKTKKNSIPVVIMFTNHAATYNEKATTEKVDYFFDKTTEFEKLLTTIKGLIQNVSH